MLFAVSCGKGGDDAPVKGTPVAKVTLNKTSLELYKGDEIKLVAEVTPDDATDKTLTWSSTRPAVATVDNDGKVTAVAEGEAIITAKSKNNITASCTVTVSALTDETDITAKFDAEFAKSLQASGLIPDAAKIKYADVKALEKIAVASTKVTSLKGIEFMKALRVLMISGSPVDEVVLSNNTELEKIMIEDTPMAMLEISKCPKLTYLMCSNNKLEWLDISNNKLLTTCYFDGNPGYGNGKFVVAVWDGFTQGGIQCTRNKWEYGEEKMEVTPLFHTMKPLKAISFGGKTEVVLEQGGIRALSVTPEPAEATIVRLAWSIDNDKVVKLEAGNNNYATITALAKGTATLTAKSLYGCDVSASIKITVIDKPTGISFDGHSGEEDKASFLTWFGKELDLKAKVSPEGLPLTILAWDWNNPNRAHEECIVEHNVTADKATVTSYWTKNTTFSGIDVTARVKSDAGKVAYAHVTFRTVCWIEYENDYGKIQSEHGFAYVEGGVDNWKYVWRADLYPTAIYFAAYCPPLDYSDLVIPSRYYPDAYIPTSEYTLTVSKDDAKLVKITKADGDKYYKIEPLATKTTSVELIYTCGKFVQRFTLDIIK